MKPVTVTQVNEYIARKLREDYKLKGLPVEGEISGLSKSGPHYYLTLKDKESIIKCAVWGSNVRKIDMSLLENGKKIIAVGDISPYPKGGNYSFSINYVEAAGEGDLKAEYERVRKLLQDEGLFDSIYKKPIPEFPERIGIVTSATGAAIEDIKKIITSKNNCTDIIIFPTLVQGIGAAESICANINLANRLNETTLKIDTLIVGRGGGSAEDLAAFNDEAVARAIFASSIPVISAVGHESDISISDFVADKRAETPTAAADMAVMDSFALAEDIVRYRKQLVDSMKYKIEMNEQILDSKILLLHSNISNRINQTRNMVEMAVLKIQESDPRNIFRKGYAAVLDDEGKVVPDITGIIDGDSYSIIMNNGSFKATVNNVERDT